MIRVRIVCRFAIFHEECLRLERAVDVVPLSIGVHMHTILVVAIRAIGIAIIPSFFVIAIPAWKFIIFSEKKRGVRKAYDE